MKQLVAILIALLLAAYCSAKPVVVHRAPDTTAPLVVVTETSLTGTTLSIVASEPITGSAGFTLTASGGAATLTYASGDGSEGLIYTTSRAIDGAETLTLAYTAGTVEDLAGNALANFSGVAIANNSGDTTGTPYLPAVTPSPLPPAGWNGAADIVLTSGQSVQTAIDNADTSDGMYIIELTAGDTFGPALLEVEPQDAPGDGSIVIRTSAWANLPAAGDRLPLAPANDADLPILIGRTSTPHELLYIHPSTDGTGGASKVALIGLRMVPADTTDPNVLITLGKLRTSFPIGTTNKHAPTPADLCEDIIVYQCRIDEGDGTAFFKDCMVGVSGNGCAVSCCDFHGKGMPTTISDGVMAVRIIGGTGHRIYNNRLESGGMGFFLSDNDPPMHGILPTDVTIDHNYVTRPIGTNGEEGELGPFKNAAETKGGERVLIEKNITAANSNSRAFLLAGQRMRVVGCWGKATSSANVYASTAANNLLIGCHAEGGLNGYIITGTSSNLINCVIDGAAADGISVGSSAVRIISCSIYNSGSDGISVSSATDEVLIANTIIDTSAAYGINSSAGVSANITLLNNAYRANTTADLFQVFESTQFGAVAESSSPFTNAGSDDFSIVSTALSKGAGFPGAFENESFIGYPDIGAVQRQESASNARDPLSNSIGL